MATRAAVAREAGGRLAEHLVKAGPAPRDGALQWFAALLNRSDGAGAYHVDRRKTPGQPTRVNACAALLRLCRPFLGKADKEANVRADLAFLERSPLGRAAFPGDLTRVNFEAEAPAPAADAMEESDDDMYDDEAQDDALKAALALSQKQPEEQFHFVTTCFMLTARAVHLGYVVELSKHQQMERTANHLLHRHGRDSPDALGYYATTLMNEAALLTDALVDDALAFAAAAARWINRLPDDALRRCPEHLLEDVGDLPALLARFRPDHVRRAPPFADLLECVARCLGAKEALVRSPHARDKLCQALYECYLPNASKHAFHVAPGMPEAASDANAALLLAPPERSRAVRELAPALLWLFGDAEHLGSYDTPDARLRISALIRHLWASAGHREAFRALAGDRDAFVTFANGLLNETNLLVAGAIEKLPEIRNHQIRTGIQDPGADPELVRLRDEYRSANEARREELDERASDDENHLKRDLRLCTETLGLVELLTDDAVVGGAFCLDQIRGRLADMLASVVRAFTGRQSLSIKVHNPEQYGFDPKDILGRVGRIATHFASTPNFAASLAGSGYFAPDLLPKCVATLRRLRALTDAQLDALDALATAAAAEHGKKLEEDAIEVEAPDEFLDPLTCELMTDPVKLPSGNTCDSSTIRTHLLNERSDPFNRAPLEPKDLVPDTELKAKIDAWKAEMRAKRS